MDSVGLYVKPKEEDMGKCRFWMKVFGLEGLEERGFLKLSSGEQRLVDIFHHRGESASQWLVESASKESVHHQRFCIELRRVQVGGNPIHILL